MNYANLTKQELLDLVTEQQTLKDAVDAKDKEIGRLNQRIVELQESIKTMITKENYDAYRKDLEEQRNKAADIANRYIQAHRDLMKVFKINLDVAISHEELLTERLK
jgi:hypothetical protein